MYGAKWHTIYNWHYTILAIAQTDSKGLQNFIRARRATRFTIEKPTAQRESWRDLIGVVPQDITLFNGNVVDNILLGKEDAPQRLLSFIEEYGFEPFFNTLPQGLSTILGEEGINLSGGQRQMIALMRALYQNPQLLLLDEFTSAMDRETEQFVLALLKKLKAKMTIIFISHRLHSLKKIADRIAIINNGIVENVGTHSELMQSDNFYSLYWKEIY